MPLYPNVAIVIPVLNEEDILAETLQRTLPIARPIVVDNGSTDSSIQIAKQYEVILVRESRKGYGQAVLTGMAEAKRHRFEIVVILDADLSNDPEDISTLIAPIIEEKADLVLGARTRPEDKDNQEPHQRFGNDLAIFLLKRITGYQFSDLAPFRAFRLHSILDLDMEDQSYGWNIEMQIKATRNQLRIQEIELPYHQRKAGQSKISGNLRASLKAGAIILSTALKYAR